MSNLPSLKALAEAKTEGITNMKGFRVDPAKIVFEEGFNLREEGPELDAHIERLYQAMKQGAFIPPVDVSVVNGQIIARDGHCRTRAALRVKAELPEYTLECRQLRGNEVDAVLHMLGTGSGGKPLSPLEQGKGFLRLVKMGLKPTEIAAKLGVHRSTVDNCVALAEAPVEVHKMVASGEVSSTVATIAVKNGTEGVEALKNAVEENRKSEQPKKKITAKVLAGTAAAKRPAPAPKPEENQDDQPKLIEVDEVRITITREAAHAALAFISMQSSASDDPMTPLGSFAAAIRRATA